MAPETNLRGLFRSAAARAGASGFSATLTVLLLGAMQLEVLGHDVPADPTEYHRRVKAAALESIPYSVGDWLGTDVESPRAAIEMLHPNVLENRAYTNLRTGEKASLLLVQCTDARDILGHYPPVCYVAHGMTLESAANRDWAVGGRTINGKRYRFLRTGVVSDGIAVDNFMVLPSGDFGRDMESVGKVAKSRRVRQFGAAQVQVLTDACVNDARRDEIFRELIGPIVPALDCIGSAAACGGGKTNGDH